MRFSLILATVGRIGPIKKSIQSIIDQNYENAEIIIIDQNLNNELDDIVKYYTDKINIKHIKTKIKGLSRARNIGLQQCSGDIIAFPDDDSWYSPNTFESVVDLFKNTDIDAVTGMMLDEDGKKVDRFSDCELILNSDNVWRNSISITIFIRKKVIDSIGFFDERIGVGSDDVFQSGEETDYLLRVIEHGFNIRYIPKIQVYHPNKKNDLSENMIRRNYLYGCGTGYVLKKHNAPFIQKSIFLIRPLGGSILALLSLNIKLCRTRFNTFRGRICGMING